MNIYEACVGNYNEALKAESLGANRIELCDNLLEDGTTPSYGTIKRTIEELNIPVMVIIRPRGGGFNYSLEEIEIMKDDIRICKKLGAYGVVIGALKNNAIDINVIKELVKIAKPMSITFHMAFDEIEDKYKAIDELVSLGVDRILTKGGNKDALNGKEMIKSLVEYSNDRISIMPGKGVTKENREFILNFTGAKEIHGTKVV
ncbi:copper homeostasis protein CutC [Clostridium weizhouense]|uniref:PF03932 family protein CutC n=1 Tax=Clostridium weizhouense TaxID=2859781 RepID=A0ABS7ARU1_9CLOT|nr:copper homeostasis protein CutC [Clostridium weizhouense]MBW6411385.1 copper homeostasis protein CutC [Clostridium weizhouense]